MKTIIWFVAILLTSLLSNTSCAQELSIREGTVFLDQKAIFSYDQKAPNNEFHLYRLQSEKTIVEIKQVHKTGEKEYKILTFLKQEITIESAALSKRNWKYILQLLLNEKVINTNGVINLPNLVQFAQKYDDKINSTK